MDKNLTVYPIASGNKLNIFANEGFGNVKIMDMAGNVVLNSIHPVNSQWQMDIIDLASATYIVEVVYTNSKIARSVFVKL